MVNIVLVEPEIPMNTGNIARTCAVTGCSLHLVRPLGFDISEPAVRRAGLDYWNQLDLHVYEDTDDFFVQHPGARLWLLSSKAPRSYAEADFHDGDFLVFGRETKGLPEELLARYYDRCLRIPMLPGARCLNLGNAVAVTAYEALRQLQFPGFSAAGRMQDW